MKISLAKNYQQIVKSFPVMLQLRSTLHKKDFLDQVKRQQQTGYNLVFLEDVGKVMAVAGFRITENISAHRTLYVSDFVTDERYRLKGYGTLLFDWLVLYARKTLCKSLQLDSSLERSGAHQFYFSNNMSICSYRFILPLE